MAAILLPLLSLSVDITRAFYVRLHLQSATDAACEAAALALDVPQFRETGRAEIHSGLAFSWAGREFSATLADQSTVHYTASLGQISFLDPRTVMCRGTASVEGFFLHSSIRVEVFSVSEMRVSTQ
jgi:Flp pilus assembly protein TadG